MSRVNFIGEQAQFKPVVSRLKLENFRGFSELDIDLEEDLTVFISRNGGGKSTILDAIWGGVIALSVVFEQTESDNTAQLFHNYDIKNGANGSTIDVGLDIFYQWLKNPEEPEGVPTLEEGHKSVQVQLRGNEQGFELKRSLTKEWTELADFLDHGHSAFDSKPVFRYYRSRELLNGKPTVNRMATITAWIDRRQKVLTQSTNKSFEQQLEWIRAAVSKLLSDEEVYYTDLKVTYGVADDFLSVTKKHGTEAVELGVQQLSSGELYLLEIVADIAISLIEANPGHGDDFDPLANGFGVVLIDEVGIHLHPSWQRSVLVKIQNIFPGLQFVFSTHSPLILSGIMKRQGRMIKDFEVGSVGPVEGRDASSILEDEFGEEERPKEYQSKLKQFYELLENNRDQAETLLGELKEIWGDKDEEVIRAESYLEIF
jgi:predicted ATP-binding protein involved in virulence